MPLAADKYLKFQRADVMKATRQLDGKILISKSIAAAEAVDGDGKLIWKEM